MKQKMKHREYISVEQAKSLKDLGMPIEDVRWVLFQQVFRWFSEEHLIRPKYTFDILHKSWEDEQSFYIEQMIVRLVGREKAKNLDIRDYAET